MGSFTATSSTLHTTEVHGDYKKTQNGSMGPVSLWKPLNPKFTPTGPLQTGCTLPLSAERLQ